MTNGLGRIAFLILVSSTPADPPVEEWGRRNSLKFVYRGGGCSMMPFMVFYFMNMISLIFQGIGGQYHGYFCDVFCLVVVQI